ncbi:hypothetical protein PIB30_015860 [Stylosanthes scabra]|uniref:Uncharacterized protein n=1 Tax=Stylosanthes scabra TaxID=79078 RepID=A0ABU6S6L8_9FABA|nr:hypothetical protein [Stylosanthes scabra]
MALSLIRFSWHLWGGKEKEPVCNNGSSTVNSPISSSEMVKFPLTKETKMEPPTTQRRVRRKWQRREKRVDRGEYKKDVVLVPSDDSDSDYDYDSDWSIGWLEPHGSDFQSSDVDDDDDDSFAVLVPCYKHGCKQVEEASNNVLLSAIQNLSYEFSSTGKNYMEQWLACLENFEA